MSLHAEAVGDAVVLTIDRPETRNAIDQALARRLGDAVRLASADPRVRGIVLTGAGEEVFVAGGDVNEMSALTRDGADGQAVMAMFDHLAVIERCDVPVIAAVQGSVYGGGCELLLLCDFVFIEAHAHVAFRHVKMGLSPAWGGMTRLVERIGPLEATRLLLSAEKIDAAEALRVRLVNDVVPRGAARDRAVAQVNRIADNPRTTVTAMKHALRRVREARRRDAIELEQAAFSERWGKPDHRQAMDAFLSRK